MQTLLQFQVPSLLAETAAEIVAFTPRLVGALLVLLVGWFLGAAAFRVVARVADRIQLDRAVLTTPLGKMLGGTEKAVSRAFGSLAKWFVYALAILAAANVLAVQLLSEWIATAVSYLPSLVAGLLVIVVGFVLADFVADAVRSTRAATEARITGAFAQGTRLFLYFVVIVIGLSTMGIDTTILNTFAQALAWGVAAAVAIGVGGALAFGGRDFVAENIDRWAGSARSVSRRPPESGEGQGPAAADGGVEG
jgi:hypothetical protein